MLHSPPSLSLHTKEFEGDVLKWQWFCERWMSSYKETGELSSDWFSVLPLKSSSNQGSASIRKQCNSKGDVDRKLFAAQSDNLPHLPHS